jgi:hypothetical protein
MTEPFPWWRRPPILGLLGLALVFGGWKLSTYVPETPRQAEQRRQADEVRRGGDPELARKVDLYERSALGTPPYAVLGRVVLLVGLVMFVAAGVMMYTQPPPPDEEAGQTPEQEPASP